MTRFDHLKLLSDKHFCIFFNTHAAQKSVQRTSTNHSKPAKTNTLKADKSPAGAGLLSAPENVQSVCFFSCLLAIPLARQRFLHTALLSRLQVEAVTLHFLDDVLGLHLALEAPQCILKRLAFLHANLCQSQHPNSCLTGRPGTFTGLSEYNPPPPAACLPTRPRPAPAAALS